MKKQIVIIHGGSTYDTYEGYIKFLKNQDFDPNDDKRKKWRYSLEEKLGSDFEVFLPMMPNGWNAKYLEWKIWFEKIIPFIKDDVVFIGHSLGGIFLAKYLSENNFPKRILATYLIAAPYGKELRNRSLADFILPEDLSLFEKQGGKIFLYHSKDDPIIPFIACEKYEKALSGAKKVIFRDKGHFMQEEFPELVDSVKNLY